MGRFSVALCHHPVLHKDGSIITSAITNTDLHDITRTCTAFDVDTFYVVTPVSLQQDLVRSLIEHWTLGPGSKKNPDRQRAFACMKVIGSIEEAVALEGQLSGAAVEQWGTTAKDGPHVTSWAEGKALLGSLPAVLMLLGTSHGLSDDAMAKCARRLAPIHGAVRRDGSHYNHLSVRAAAAIMLHALRA